MKKIKLRRKEWRYTGCSEACQTSRSRKKYRHVYGTYRGFRI